MNNNIKTGARSLLRDFAVVIGFALVFTFTACDFLFGDNGTDTVNTVIVQPMTQTRWHQRMAPYNNLFPEINGVRNVDCGNLSWSQIMAFYRHPVQGSGQSEPLTQLLDYSGTIPAVDFNVAYDWDNMLNEYPQNLAGVTQQQQDAVATLIYHVAVSAEWIDRMRAMTEVFGYDKSIQTLHRRFYDDDEWENIIRAELDAGRPVRYWGQTYERYLNGAPAGDQHAFVVDGYDDTGRFHANMGLSGWDDGWYFFSGPESRPSTVRYFYNQRMEINIKPDAGGVPAAYEFGLVEFSADESTVSHNEHFTVSTRIRSNSTLDIFPGGHWGAVLVNNANEIVEVLGTTGAAERRPQSYTNSFNMDCFVPETVMPGQYRLMMAVRPTGGDWKIITRSSIGDGVPNAINITVNQGTETAGGGYGLRLTYFVTASNRTSASHNQSFNVSVRMRNRGAEQFAGGQVGAALIDNSGRIVEVIGIANIDELDVGDLMPASISIGCTIPSTAALGLYQLMILTKPNDRQWRIVTQSLVAEVPTSIGFQIQ